jgi:hypothetical protein
MRLYFLYFVLTLCTLNIGLAQADTNQDINLSKCTPPLKEEEEFEPSLCPFKFPDVKKVEILDRFEDKNDIYYNHQDCTTFFAVKETEIVKFFKNANIVQPDDVHAKMAETSPCRISGKLFFKNGKTADWSLQSSIYLGYITLHPSEEYFYLYCPKSCIFIPTYQPSAPK